MNGIPKQSLLTAEADDFKQIEEISEGIYSKTIQVLQVDTEELYAMKIFTNLTGPKDLVATKLYQICDSLSKGRYPFCLPPSYISIGNDQNNSISTYTIYKPKGSLLSIIEQQIQGIQIQDYDSTQEYLILYGISCFLECFHLKEKVHGSIKLTNILLDDKFNPFVSDCCLFEITKQGQISQIPKKPIEYIVSIPPEILRENKFTKASDIYSFGILILQILKHEINIFSDYSEDVESIAQLIQTNTKPKIPDEFPSNISDILKLCFSDNPKQRPTATEIKKVFETILQEEMYKKRFDSFLENLKPPKEEQNDSEISELKRKADIYDLDSMFTYGKRLFSNQKEKEGMDYLRFAAKRGYVPARNFYNNVRKDSSQNLDQLDKDESKGQHRDKAPLVHLRDNPLFENQGFNIDEINQKVQQNIDKVDTYEFDEKKLLNKNFILTKGAKKRLTELKKYIDAGIPVILEGPTGTSKTLSAEIICELTGRTLIRFNLSSETKSTDLLGRYVGDSDSWARIKMVLGPFYDAFENGKTLLLDEINLGDPECLQFIEDTIDSGVISVEIQGIPLKEVKMHPEFRLIATQNPNKGLFVHKRQDLGNKFKSRFQVINFPGLSNELYDIAIGLADKFKYREKNKEQIIRDLVDFHLKWSSSSDIKDDIQCFTIREIAATVKSLSKHKNIYDTIMTIYGARYQNDKRNKLEEEFRKYQSFKNCQPETFEYPSGFPKCFKNKSLENALKSVLISFENHRHVILTGAEGSGLTQIARWISQWYQQKNGDQNQSNKECFCICTVETKCTDLIGRHKLSENINTRKDDELLQWKNGVLLEAVSNGYLLVLDNLDEAPATVSERQNGLLDQKYEEGIDESKFIFEVPENPNERFVPIHKDFRLLCICKLDNINQMSPAFINRFDVVVLENQIEDIGNDYKSLISMLMEQESSSKFSHKPKVIEYIYQKINEKDESDTKDTKITMFQLSQLCKAVTRYIDFFNQQIDDKAIVDFAANILNKNEDFEITSEIEMYLLSKLKTQDQNKEFFFENSPNLRRIIAKIYACSLINLPVCLIGPTGVGKTSAAREFAKIRPTANNMDEPFLMHTFHAGTKPKDFYGTTTINDEQVVFINGTLTTAMVNGQTFIADEMNLSSISTMKSLVPALEPISKQSLYIAGIEEPIQVNPEFFFIACQNELGTNGRNAIPRSIASRFRYFYYPTPEKEDISPICREIAQSLYKEGEKPSFSKQESEKVGEYMLALNKLKQRIIPQWSLRDITKLFQRIHHQDTNKEDFKGMTLCKNLLFYTLSPVNNEDTDGILKTIIDLISNIFFPSDNGKKEELEKCYQLNPTIVNNFLMKGNCGIKVDSFKNINIFAKLPSLLNSMFKILLSDSTEPIILIGPSGFKTFLAQLFLNDAKIVTLNQESTVAQLLGSSAFLTKEDSKVFYIENICKICQINKIQEYINQYKRKELTKENFQEKIKPFILKLSSSFKYAINHLINKLFDENQGSSNNCILSNLELEFRPGLILSAIIEGKSLILKNLSNIPTIILERFNELFSGKHNLTLNEDLHNTFTSKTEKELCDISSSFRVFATCLPNSGHKLSEAVLSRFSVIYVPAYSKEEQEIVLKKYIELNKLSFNDSLISILINFSKKMNSSLKKNFTFPQMINSVEMCSRLNKNVDESQWLFNMGIILYRLGYGILEERNKTKADFVKIFADLGIKLPASMITPINKNPFQLSKSKDGYQGLLSKVSNIFLTSPDTKEDKTNLAFTPMFSEMLDTLHLGMSINIPVIFEGMPGQGKQTAINYISNILGYQVINVIISQKTKVEDLFGKITITRDKKNNINIQPIETKLVKVLKSNSDSSSKSIIVFHNINNASSGVLEVLVSIFDQHQKDFLLPNGSTITKGQVKIIGIFNPQNGIFNRDKLPSSLIYSSIYHIVNNPNNKEILSVIESQFKNTNFGLNEAESFYHNFIETKKISDESNAPLTLNDIVKYKKFRIKTYEKFDCDIVSSILFAYRFLQYKTIQTALKNIGVIDMKFIPDFDFNSESNKIIIKASKESSNSILLNYDSKAVDTEYIKSELASLTLPEKRCMLFLAFSVLSKQACIIEGETASGKSHIIRLFAKMLGKKLNVYQMNSETSSSILTGQSVLYNHLSSEDISDINFALTDLERIPKISDYIANNITNIQPEKWTRNLFTDLIDFTSSDDFKAPEIDEIVGPAIQIIFETIQPAKRFHIEESSFIRAMTNGEWVLFDGIESSPSEIIEKISSLCGDNPQLDLLECGEGYYFTSNNLPGSKPIHKAFRIFFTYNPTSQIENKTLDPDFMNNCVSFTLPTIDSTPENSAQRILGTMIQYYPEELSVEVSKRLAMFHSSAKKESQKDGDSFAGDIEFTGRTVNNVTKEFIHHAKVFQDVSPVEQIFRPICYSMKYYYFNSYVNAEKETDFKSRMMNVFYQKPDPEIFKNLTYEGINLTDKYKDILIDLRNIQIHEKEQRIILFKNDKTMKKPFNFIFTDFVQKCFKLIQINDIGFILDHIEDTINIIGNSNTDFSREISQLKVISNILKDVKKGKKFLHDNNAMNLNDEDLLKTEQLNLPLLRFYLLCKLTEKQSEYFTLNIPPILYDLNFVSLMNSVLIMQKENTLENFKAFIFHLNSYPNFIPLIESRFPYNLFNETPFEMIHYILPMIRLLHDSQTTFNILIMDEKISFIYKKTTLFEPTYIFEDDQELSISASSQINFTIKYGDNLSNKIQKDQFIDTESVNSFFFNLTKYFVTDDKNVARFLSSDLKSSFINKSNPRENQISQLSLLLSNNNLSLLIANIWPIVYSFPKDTIKTFSKYLLPLEKDMLLLFYNIYKNIDKDNIIKVFNFSVCMSERVKQSSYLGIIMNHKFSIANDINFKEANEIKDKLESEIAELRKASRYISEEIWSPDKYINLLNKKKKGIIKKIDELISKNKNLKLMKKLQPILQQLEEISTKSNESLINQIYNEIKKDSQNNLTEEKIKFYQYQVNQFLDSLKIAGNQYAKNSICWPTYRKTKEISNFISPDMKLYQIIIWYSTIKRIFNKINNSNSQNVYPFILELNDFKEMKDIVNFLTSRFLHIENSKTKGLNSDENSMINGILNAHFIFKLMDQQQTNSINQLHSKLNDLANRKAINDENTLFWIHKIANQYTPDFCLSLPIFNPKDLIYLFIGYCENGRYDKFGPLFNTTYSTIKDDTVIRNLQQLLSTNLNNFTECTINIAQCIYKTYSENNNPLPNDFQGMKKFLAKYKGTNMNIKSALSIMEIAEKIDTQKVVDFTFDDTFFLNQGWIQKEDFVNKYPSLVFWLCKNHLCADKLKDIYGNQPFSTDELPFWLFILRLMSSEDCLSFDSQSTTVTAKNLSRFINKQIRTHIRNKLLHSQSIGTKWLNILLPSPPSELTIPKYQSFYQMFYQFFQNLSEDKKILQSETSEIKMDQLNKFVQNVCNFMFNDDPTIIFNLPIDSENSIMSLIRNPNEFVGNEIYQKMRNISNSFIHSQKMKDLIDFTSKLKDTVNAQIEMLRKTIEKDNFDKETEFEDKKARSKAKGIRKMKENVLKSIKEYKKQFKKLSTHEPIPNLKEFQKCCDSLIQNFNILPKCFDDTAEPLELSQFLYKTKYKGSYYFCTCRLSKNDMIDIKSNRPYYFYPDQKEDLDKKYFNNEENWSIVKLFPFNESFDVDKFCDHNYKETEIFTKPILSFGSNKYYYDYHYININSDQLITKITNVANFVKNLQDELNTNHINDNTFWGPKDINNEIQSLSTYFNAHYSDYSKCDSINLCLSKLNNTFTQLSNYILGINYELRERVEKMWNASYQRNNLKPVFDDGYELPIPKYDMSIRNTNYFRNITNTSFITNPILSVDNNSIVCCFKSINCTLGPFVPSLYSKKFAMNFISFIDESFTMKLEVDPKYSNLFSSRKNFSKWESAQIWFSLPNVESEEPKIHEISTKIIFESEKLRKLTLPCNFSIKTVPLSFLISCKQSQLSFDNNTFYVCKDDLKPFSILTFTINNFYLHEKTAVLYQFNSLDGNTISKPKIIQKLDQIELQIPYVMSFKRLHAELILKFSNEFSTPIVIDAKVIPFDFEFEVYDPNEKAFSQNATVYYTPKYLDRQIKLHFRILCPSFVDDLIGKIENTFPFEIQSKFIIKGNYRNKEFLIKDNKEFDVILKISSPLKSQNYSYGYSYYYSNLEQRDPSYKLSITIYGKQKDITLKFSQFENAIEFLNQIDTKLLAKFNGYAYKTADKEWNPVHKNDDPIGYSCFVSPFSYFKSNLCKISYFIGCKVEAKENIFILINEDGESIKNEEMEARIERKDGIFLRTIKRMINKNTDLYPIFGVSGSNWYPVFETYPQIKWEKLDIVKEKIEIANKDIENIEKRYSRLLNNPTHFYNFFKLLLSGKVIKHIEEFIQLLPSEIKKDFDYIIATAERLNEKSPLMRILSHNAIILFKEHFERRYKEIKRNNNCVSFCPLSQEEIDQKVDECYEEYCQIDSKSKKYSTSTSYLKFKEIELAAKDIQLELKPGMKSNVFLYTEKSSPIPKPDNCQPKYVSSYNSEISDTGINDIKFELPPINIPKESEINSLTIPEFNDIYFSALKGTRLLPLFVSKMKSNKSKQMEKEANNYFSALLRLYRSIPVKDNSFISITTNLFSESFASMIGKFKKAGVDLTYLLSSKCIISNENYHDFFEYPDKDENSIPPDQWNINEKRTNAHTFDDISIVPEFDVEPENANTKESKDKSQPKSDDEDNDDPSVINQEPQESLDDDKYSQFHKLISSLQDQEDQNAEEENGDEQIIVTDSNNQENDAKDGMPNNVFVVSDDTIKEDLITHADFDEMNFTDENGIKRAISRMREMKNKPILNIQDWELPKIDPEFLDTTEVNFPIKELIPHGFYFANKFIKEASEMDIPKSKFCVNILVDCSAYINDENKIFNMLIICGLTTALESLEIPYSVAVIGDKNFKCVIKTFNELHSAKCLQKILDCLLIKRYRTKLAGSIKFAIETMSFENNDQNNQTDRPYRAIFTFSDGLDEQLVLTNAWSNSILVGKDLSFGFIFIKSSKLVGDNLNFVEEVWNKFETETNKNKPLPIVSIASIKSKITDELSDKLSNLFRTVMKRAIVLDPNVSVSSKQIINTYADAAFTIDDKLSNINRFSSFIRSDYSAIKDVYATSTQVLKKANSLFDKLDLLKYRNKLKKIANSELDEKIKKEQLSDFIKSFLINKHEINQASLEAIFKPNKASQTVLSTTGTDFDITALVLNLINPVPDPMIYLEEKGGLIRNYGISIVVDSSISCFDELSGPHSFQTLRMILSSLATLDISCFDLIVAGNPQPTVVCSEVGTIHSLSFKSPLFNSLLAILQNPIHDVDLCSAIHTAFDLRRMRSAEHASILFVLTNGLYNNLECERILNSVNVCVQSGITAFGIGIGNYPKGIEKLFPHVIFSLNPANVMKAVASFYGDPLQSVLDEMKLINFVPKIAELESTIKTLIDKEKTPIFNSLKDSLDNIMRTLDAFDDMINEEQIVNGIDGYMNPVGEGTQIYTEGLLKDQKILIVMLWDKTLNSEEETFVHPDYIDTPSEDGAGCIRTAVEYYGIKLKTVQNYEDAINELLKQTKPGFCDYYAVWVFCGPPLEILPDPNADPNLVGQFNDVLIQFWQKGGSIVFWAEGDSLHYQVNLFLQTVDFGNECPSGKASFRIGGDHKGTNILLGEESDTLERPKTFNKD